MKDSSNLPSLEALEQKIQAAQKRNAPPDAPDASMSGFAQAVRLAVDLLAGVIVGGIIGYWLDYFFSTGPLFLIICILLGAGGGMRNMMRTAQQLDKRSDSAR